MTTTCIERAASSLPGCANCANCDSCACDAPAFQHDCNTCVFLGRYDDDGRMADLYAHICGSMPTVIARYSSEGSDYASGSCFSYGQIESLTEARRRAQAKGVWQYDVYEALLHARPQCTACYQELRSALPFTEDYQAYTAFVQGNLERAHGLVRHLLALAHARKIKYRPDALLGQSLIEVQGRIHQVVSTYRGGTGPQSTGHLEELTRFIWLELNAQPLQIMQGQLEQ